MDTERAAQMLHERANWPTDAVILEAVHLRALLEAHAANMRILHEFVQDHANPRVPDSLARSAGAMTAIGILSDEIATGIANVDDLTAKALQEWAS